MTLRWFTLPEPIRQDISMSGLNSRYFMLNVKSSDTNVSKSYLYKSFFLPIKTLDIKATAELMKSGLEENDILYIINKEGILIEKKSCC